MYADYHLHTLFSDDGQFSMEEMIEKAISCGLEEICFTDHVDYGIMKDWSEGDIEYRFDELGRKQPLANVDYPKYFEKLKEAQSLYQNQIRIKKGLEFGIQTHTIPQFETLFDTWKDELDFILLSIHQVEDKEFWTGDFQEGKTQLEFHRRYYQELYDVMTQYKNYSVLAHLDLISRYDQNGVLDFSYVEDQVREILKLVIHDGKGIEINTSAGRYGLNDTEPSKKILSIYHEYGGRIITTGSDAHNKKNIGEDFPQAHQVLREIGFEEFCTFEKGKPIFHPLEK